MQTMVNIKVKYIKGKSRIYALKKVIRYAIVKVLKKVSMVIDNRARIDFSNGILLMSFLPCAASIQKSEKPKSTDMADITQLPMFSHSVI